MIRRRSIVPRGFSDLSLHSIFNVLKFKQVKLDFCMNLYPLILWGKKDNYIFMYAKNVFIINIEYERLRTIIINFNRLLNIYIIYSRIDDTFSIGNALKTIPYIMDSPIYKIATRFDYKRVLIEYIKYRFNITVSIIDLNDIYAVADTLIISNHYIILKTQTSKMTNEKLTEVYNNPYSFYRKLNFCNNLKHILHGIGIHYNYKMEVDVNRICTIKHVFLF